MKNLWVLLVIAVVGVCVPCARGQEEPQDAPTVMDSSVVETLMAKDCCGPISDGGRQLLAVLDGMDVEHKWPQNLHVNWKTGEPDGLEYGNRKTHCSAFAAAVGERLGVYMLRPPDHNQMLLASAQGRWFASAAGRREGWRHVATWNEAQRLANQGDVVVVDYINPNPHEAGHIAVVRPAVKTYAQLKEDGPETTQAGSHNVTDDTVRRGFHVWPNGLVVYAHTTKFSAGGQ